MLETNKALLRRHFDEVLNQGHLDVIDEIYTDDYVLDAPVQTDGSALAQGKTLGRDGLKRRVTLFRTAFPDLHFTLGTVMAEDDLVAVQYTFAGTHLGMFRELEPTNHAIRVTGLLIARLRDGQIAQVYSVFDSGDMMRQLQAADVHEEHHGFWHNLIEHIERMLR